MADRCQRIAIIGGGFTGTALAVELMRRCATPTKIFVIERSGSFGPGLAYGTQDTQHLLNVCAGKMSLYEDRPNHFTHWLAAYATIPPPHGESWEQAFVPRCLYGRYLESSLRDAIAMAPPHIDVALITATVSSVRMVGDGVSLMLTDGGRIGADRAVLCTGNPPPASLRRRFGSDAGADRIIDDPWATGSLDRVAPGERVALIGTGLTMVDIALALASRRAGVRFHAVSRHGLLPHVHSSRTVPDTSDAQTKPLPPRTVRRQLLSLRAEAARAARSGADWQSVVDAFRGEAQALWHTLSPLERARFLRHLRVYWDIHRHRMAPEVGAKIARLRASGALQLTAGRIIAIENGMHAVALTVMPRGHGSAVTVLADRVVNCTGPAAGQDPLYRDLLDGGSASRDALGLGIEVGLDCRLVTFDGRRSSNLFALGPPTRAAFWEITSVPEIRKQCARQAFMIERASSKGARANWEVLPNSIAASDRVDTLFGRSDY